MISISRNEELRDLGWRMLLQVRDDRRKSVVEQLQTVRVWCHMSAKTPKICA